MTGARGGADIAGDIAVALGVRLDGARPVPGHRGQRRTFFAHRDGEPVVAKWGLDEDLPAKIPYVAGQVPELRRRGIPAAPVLAHGPMPGGGYAWLQPRLPGRPAWPTSGTPPEHTPDDDPTADVAVAAAYFDAVRPG